MANSRQEKIARYKEQKEQERRLKVVEIFLPHNYLESFSVTWNWWNKVEFFSRVACWGYEFCIQKRSEVQKYILSIF